MNKLLNHSTLYFQLNTRKLWIYLPNEESVKIKKGNVHMRIPEICASEKSKTAVEYIAPSENFVVKK